MDHIDLGTVPSDEDCAQLGVDPDYPEKARRECRALARQLMRTCGEPPPGARFRLMSNLHDFGTYYSLVIDFDPEDEDALAYAYRCEEEGPSEWDAEARRELGIADNRGDLPQSEVRP